MGPTGRHDRNSTAARADTLLQFTSGGAAYHWATEIGSRIESLSGTQRKVQRLVVASKIAVLTL